MDRGPPDNADIAAVMLIAIAALAILIAATSAQESSRPETCVFHRATLTGPNTAGPVFF